MDLSIICKDINIYLRLLEDVIIQTISYYDIIGIKSYGETGVWVNNKKICSIGIKVSRWISMHGMALNINTKLNYFKYINPCGLNKQVTSIYKELGNYYIDISQIKCIIKKNFQKIFNVILI